MSRIAKIIRRLLRKWLGVEDGRGVPAFGEPAIYQIVKGVDGDFRVEVKHERYQTPFTREDGWLDLQGLASGFETIEQAEQWAHAHAHQHDTVKMLGAL